jgi:hypothetical protein
MVKNPPKSLKLGMSFLCCTMGIFFGSIDVVVNAIKLYLHTFPLIVEGLQWCEDYFA